MSEPQVVKTTAPLANVALCMRALERAMKRPEHLPGIVAFYGLSGEGKTTAAIYAANHYRAYYVEAKDSWTRKAMLLAILNEMGVVPAKTTYDMVSQAAEQLVKSRRPLIVDEMDHIVRRNLVETLRDIYEGSNAPMLLIGEERIEINLRPTDRFHNRVLDWVPSQPASFDDAKHLRGLYCKRVKIADDLLRALHEAVNGNTRRICVNLERVQETALELGKDRIGLDEWNGREFYTGEAKRRQIPRRGA